MQLKWHHLAAVVGALLEVMQYGSAQNIRIALLMIVRDEAHNIRLNLNSWGSIASFIVVGIDERTSDDSVDAINQGLPSIPG
mmetsp:Transcript_25766/g.38741  ORF Transcript_25766/g.38741 Transcript_25766/m.38741 type:complete len:82 (-) Transcript_25766:68-313(-)